MAEWNGKMVGYFILGVILATLFFAALIHGIIMHFTGFVEVAIILYFIGFILLGMAKICMWEIKKDLWNCKSKAAPRRRR